MPRPIPSRPAFVVLVLFAALAVPAAAALSEKDAWRELQRELARPENDGRMIEVLVDLAWLRPGVDPAVSALARQRIPESGGDALFHLGRALDRVPRDRTAEVAETLVATRAFVTFGLHPNYAPALYTVLWVGDRKAKEIVIPQIARERVRAALLPLIDSAIDDPELTPLVLEAAAQIGEDRARFWIEQVLLDPSGRYREQAASALAKIGNRAMDPLENALRSQDRALRLVAVRAILSAPTENELTALYEYLGAHPDDDPATLESVKETTVRLEKALEERRAQEAASGSGDVNP